MSRFSRHTPGNAALKAGLLGFAGAGKTRTASEFAVGLVGELRSRGLQIGARPVFMLDTEGGSDYVAPLFAESGIELCVDRTRSFKDTMSGIADAGSSASVLIIDNITHVWREFCEAYQRRRNRKRLEFQDWGVLKAEWQALTDAYLASPCHIILCGRAGYEYEHIEDDNGRKELVKSGIKMKAESEMAYEPSLLLFLEREEDVDKRTVRRVAHVLKDRFAVLDGKHLSDPETGGPTYEQIRPHIERLQLGGSQVSVDTTRVSDDQFDPDYGSRHRADAEQRSMALAEVREELVKMHPGQTSDAKLEKANLLEMAFGTRAWEKVEHMSLEQVKRGRNRVWQASRGHGYGEEPGPGPDATATEGSVAQ